jgi:hypothetical protein
MWKQKMIITSYPRTGRAFEIPIRRSRPQAQRTRRQTQNHDEAIAAILSAIREPMHPPAPKRRGIHRQARREVIGEALCARHLYQMQVIASKSVANPTHR